MRKVFTTLLASAIICLGFISPAAAHHQWPRCGEHWQKSQRELISMIRCLAEIRNSPGGPEQALEVFSCESGLRPDADENEPYVGLGQQDKRYWRQRAAHYGYAGFSAKNARANADVSIKMARDDGTWENDWPSCGLL